MVVEEKKKFKAHYLKTMGDSAFPTDLKILKLRGYLDWLMCILLGIDISDYGWGSARIDIQRMPSEKSMWASSIDRLYQDLSAKHHSTILVESTEAELNKLRERFERFSNELIGVDLSQVEIDKQTEIQIIDDQDKDEYRTFDLTYFILAERYYGKKIIIRIPSMGVKYDHDYVLDNTRDYFLARNSWNDKRRWTNSKNVPVVCRPFVDYISTDSRVSISKSSKDTCIEKGMKIGEYVKTTFKNLHQSGQLTPAVLNRLLDRDSSKLTFKQSLPILIPKSDSPIDSKGHRRYYSTEIVPGFWLLSQWNVDHWDRFLAWEKSMST